MTLKLVWGINFEQVKKFKPKKTRNKLITALKTLANTNVDLAMLAKASNNRNLNALSKKRQQEFCSLLLPEKTDMKVLEDNGVVAFWYGWRRQENFILQRVAPFGTAWCYQQTEANYYLYLRLLSHKCINKTYHVNFVKELATCSNFLIQTLNIPSFLLTNM